jgi:putative RecB family exonuclease
MTEPDAVVTGRAAPAPALSPSRAADFEQCALLYRLRAIDRVPEPPAVATTLGTLVHSVLERLFDAEPAARTLDAAVGGLRPEWERMLAAQPALAALHADAAAEEAFLADGAQRLSVYFRLENPARLEPAGREERLELQLDDGPLLRGVIDRIDVAPDGAIRIVDYKTGASPKPGYGQQAEFQMRFYALLVERLRGRRPALLRLLYLKDGGSKELFPLDEDLAQIEHHVRSLWNDIQRAAVEGRFRPSRSRLCSWCPFQSLCPEFGGDPGPLDPDRVEVAIGVRPAGA